MLVEYLDDVGRVIAPFVWLWFALRWGLPGKWKAYRDSVFMFLTVCSVAGYLTLLLVVAAVSPPRPEPLPIGVLWALAVSWWWWVFLGLALSISYEVETHRSRSAARV